MMGVYSYTATDHTAAMVQGTLIADTPREARNRLRDQGLSIHEIAESDNGQAAGNSVLFSKLQGWARRRPDTSTFLRELATLLEVGVPMLEALDTALSALPSSRKRGFGRSLLKVREQVSSGQSLAEAMGEATLHGRALFDEVTVAMTQVGEDAGGLGEVLGQVATYQERGRQFKNRLGSALAYPVVVLLTGIGVSLFLMTYVVPGLLESLTEAGRELPWITQAVKGTSDLLMNYGWLLLITLVAITSVFMASYQSARGRKYLHQMILKLPGVGDIVRKQAVVRLSFVLSTLMRSGLGFEQAIRIAQRSTSNLILRDALVTCEQSVHEGRDLAPALEATGAFPKTVVQVFALGQASGRLEDMLDRLAESYDRQVSTLTGRLTALLEPVLIILLAVIVGAIAFATILPILEIGNAL